MITGYYEPLLAGSRIRSARNRVPLYAAPDDLLTIDLTELYPELKDKRLRGRVEGKRVVPYWPRADIESGKAPIAGMRSSSTSRIRWKPSSCRSRARAGFGSPRAA